MLPPRAQAMNNAQKFECVFPVVDNPCPRLVRHHSAPAQKSRTPTCIARSCSKAMFSNPASMLQALAEQKPCSKKSIWAATTLEQIHRRTRTRGSMTAHDERRGAARYGETVPMHRVSVDGMVPHTSLVWNGEITVLDLVLLLLQKIVNRVEIHAFEKRAHLSKLFLSGLTFP